jgi:antitoxin component YwqK of YwqJK toxin-antitoxin module
MMRLLIFVLILPINVIACSCVHLADPVTIKDYNNSEIIILGKALKVIINQQETVYRQRQIEFQIDEVFKGKIDTKIVTIYTALSDATCGLNVKENEEWIIWAYTENNAISTNLCTRSQPKKYLSKSSYKSLKYFKSNPRTLKWKNDKGVTIAVGKLENNIPVGNWQYFYENGYLESEGFYKNGHYDGKWIRYLNPEGIVTRLHYDKKIPEDSTPDLNKSRYKIWEIQNFKEGVRDGEFIHYAYYSVDKPKSVMNYKNGLPDGMSIGYYNNGMIYYLQDYKEGELEGYERF